MEISSMSSRLRRCLTVTLAVLTLVYQTRLHPQHTVDAFKIEKIVFKSRFDSIRLSTKENLSNEYGEWISSRRKATQPSSFNNSVILIFPGAGGPDCFTSELQETLQSDMQELKQDSETFLCVWDWSEFRGTVLTAAFDSECVGKGAAFHVRIAGNPADDMQELKQDNEKFLCVWDWSEFRGNVFTAAFDSECVGEGAAEALDVSSKNNQLSAKITSVHSIGVSVGAFAANAFARKYKAQYPESHVKLTLLDPFTGRGLFGPNYGRDNFGLDVDVAEQYMNTDDPVPTTNSPLPLCKVYDVTDADERNTFVPPKGESMHTWPLVYYSRYGYRRNNQDNVIARE
eukprot:CAMPEP_0194393058 /NCGR_PEP_ID=MMETSP0174-20130528/123082_1 /TAXON_ID=216777 /ORGANISM="Proboscia alata, Strain PI-D3" /LENGTH=342 /DNA_ID=CAMNT_0039188693 /DNA_START=566 /DNA_END=1595 /DNA_ORIENTATION=-